MIYKTDLEELLKYLSDLHLIADTTKDWLLNERPDAPALCKGRTDMDEHTQVNIDLLIKPESDGYSVDGYKIELVKIPKVAHTVSQGIDTAQLEQRLAAVNWRMIDKEQLLEDNIAVIIDEVMFLRLTGSGQAQDVMDMLILKYWSSAPVMEVLDYIDLTPFKTGFSCELHGNVNDLDAVQAYNLLEGRCVMRFYDLQQEFPTDAYWLKFENGDFIEYPAYNINGALQILPLFPPLTMKTGPNLMALVLCGQRVKVNMKVGGTIVDVGIEADAPDRDIAIFNSSGKRVTLSELKELIRKQGQKPGKTQRPGR